MGSDELWEIVTGSVGGSALDNRGKVASGAGCHPSRRRIFRIIISLSPSRPPIPWSVGSPNGFYQRPVGVILAVLAAVVRPQKHSESDRVMQMRTNTRG